MKAKPRITRLQVDRQTIDDVRSRLSEPGYAGETLEFLSVAVLALGDILEGTLGIENEPNDSDSGSEDMPVTVSSKRKIRRRLKFKLAPDAGDRHLVDPTEQVKAVRRRALASDEKKAKERAAQGNYFEDFRENR